MDRMGIQSIADALLENEQRFRALVEGMAFIEWQTDASGMQMVDLESWRQLVGDGISSDQHWLDWVHPDDRDTVTQHWRQCVLNKQLFTDEFRLRCHGRGWCWTQAHAAPLLDAEGEVRKWVGMNIDISERKAAEQLLLKNQRQMSLALDITRMGFWSLNPETQQVTMDVRMRSVWGQSGDSELIDLDVILKRIHPEDRPLVAESVQTALDPNGSGYYKPTDYRLVLDDGSIRWIAANGMTMYAGRGAERHAIELFGTALDITRRKEIEDSLRESEERLQQLNVVLEDRVRERTRELVESEARLRETAEVAEQGSRQLRRLALELSRAEERERWRLAQVLHDHVQQLLVGAKMRVAALHANPIEQEVHEQLVGVTTVLDMAINATRSLAVELVPPVLQTQGLPAALQWLALQFHEQHKLTVKAEIDPLANPSSVEARDLMFQAAREFLLNVRKHAHVPQAVLRLREDDGNIILSVVDQGRGFNLDEFSNSENTFGLFHVRERVHALGGQLQILSQVGRGTTIHVTLPKQPSA